MQNSIREINARGQVVIPIKIRKALKMKIGTVCELLLKKNSIVIKIIRH